MAELTPAKFKVGDEIIVHTDTTQGNDACTKVDWTGTVVHAHDRDYCNDREYGRRYCVNITNPDGDNRRTGWAIGENNLRLLKGESQTMSDITRDLKLAKLTDDDRLLYEEGIIDMDGTPTSTGLQLAQAKLFATHKASIVADVKAAVAKRPASK